MTQGIVLIGHGAVPTDCPRDLVMTFKRLESQRQTSGGPITAAEREADAKIRNWPRTPETDPYRVGLESIGAALQARMPQARVVTAYNEFCAPSVEEAVGGLVESGCASIVLLTTMFTRGGIHSEIEIPQIVRELQARYPGVTIRYAWPYDETLVAQMLANQVQGSDPCFNKEGV